MKYTTTRMLTLLATALIAPATGCAPEDDDLAFDTTTSAEEEVDFRTTTSTTGATTIIGGTLGCGNDCGSNDPEVNGTPVPDFDRAGAPNDAGVTFVRIRHPSDLQTQYVLATPNGELVARNGNNEYSGMGLVGFQLEFLVNGSTRVMEFTKYDPTSFPMWTTNGGILPAYGMAYFDQASESWKNVCPEFADSPDQAYVTVLVGERYDLESKDVIPNTGTWITLACNNQAAFKMKRLGYGPAGHQGVTKTPAQRQATLKMITADYCGDGWSFTVSGTQVGWRNASNSVDMENPNHAIEARFDSEGAVCLSNPRHVTLGAVASQCPGIPLCSEQGSSHGWEWITRNVNISSM
jgi:hypothetical protein